MVPFGVEIIAANSDGQRKKDYGVRSFLLSPPASSSLTYRRILCSSSTPELAILMVRPAILDSHRAFF